MFRKNLATLFILFSAIFIFSQAARAQETEAATSSNLTGAALPAGAGRVLPGSVPAEVTQTFDKIAAAGNGKFRKGETEVLVWGGSDYKKANAAAIVNRLTTTLKAAGWQYSVEGEEGGLTVFSLIKEGANRRTIVGFHGATDDALIFSWMELLPANGAVNNQVENNSTTGQEENLPTQNTGGGSIVGTWGNGNMSMIGEKPVYGGGTVTPRNSVTYKYVFHPNGTFEFTGYGESTMYGCTTALFQDKRGRYAISGSTLTLTLTKNFWRNQYSCSPASNKERDYTLTPETYTFSVRRNEYGKDLVCLADGKGEACYQRQ